VNLLLFSDLFIITQRGNMLKWIIANYQLLAGILGWPIVAGVFLAFRKVIFKKWEQPLVTFEGPFQKDSTFGRIFFLSVKNVSLTGIKKIICPRRTLNECHLEAKFILDKRPIKEYSWWTDPELNPNGITLLPNSRRHSFDLVTKTSGDALCNIGTVAIGPDEKLPKESEVVAEVTLLDGDTRIATSKWLVSNKGTDVSNLKVERIEIEDEKQVLNHSYRYKSMLWFARIVPAIISFEIIWDVLNNGWLWGLELGGWLFSSSGAFVLAIESLWMLKPEKGNRKKEDNTNTREKIETVRLGIFLLMLGFVLLSVANIIKRFALAT
jgi:hypothetical protein